MHPHQAAAGGHRRPAAAGSAEEAESRRRAHRLRPARPATAQGQVRQGHPPGAGKAPEGGGHRRVRGRRAGDRRATGRRGWRTDRRRHAGRRLHAGNPAGLGYPDRGHRLHSGQLSRPCRRRRGGARLHRAARCDRGPGKPDRRGRRGHRPGDGRLLLPPRHAHHHRGRHGPPGPHRGPRSGRHPAQGLRTRGVGHPHRAQGGLAGDRERGDRLQGRSALRGRRGVDRAESAAGRGPPPGVRRNRS